MTRPWNQMSVFERLVARGWRVTADGCWEWLGENRHRDGYGVIKRNQKNVKTHRIAYELWVGEIPDGQVVRHDCDNPICVNPGHLRLGTQADNIRDMVARGRQSSGRRFTPELVAEAKARYRAGGVTQLEVEQEFGMSAGMLSRMLSRKIWKDVP